MTISINDIKISYLFQENPVRQSKVTNQISYYKINSSFDRLIVLNMSNVLIDGYSRYLAAKQLGLSEIDVIINKQKDMKIKKAKYQYGFTLFKKLSHFIIGHFAKVNYIVLDCEFLNKPKDESIKHEIIQIGLVKLDKKLKIIDNLNLYIRPRAKKKLPKKKLSKNCSHKTKTRVCNRQEILFNSINSKIDFCKAIKIINEWINKDTINYFCAWSNSDIAVLKNHFDYYKIENFLFEPSRFIDIQEIVKYENGNSLENTLNRLGIGNDAPLHNAYTDALATAKIFQKIKLLGINA